MTATPVRPLDRSVTVARAVLFHYTCADAAPLIDAELLLRPNRHPALPEPLVWLTDLDTCWREELGLTSHHLTCDRGAHRFTVADPAGCEPWSAYARRVLPPALRRALENHTTRLRPRHWWVSLAPVPVLPRRERP